MKFDPVQIQKLITKKVYFGIQIAFNKPVQLTSVQKKFFFFFVGCRFDYKT